MELSVSTPTEIQNDAYYLKSDDRISELSEDVLSTILSHLTMRDAARARVLSSSWRYLSASTTNLHFDPHTLFGIVNVIENFYKAQDARLRFVEAVDQYFEVCRIPKIDSLKICCYLGNESAHSINRWINFSIEKQTEKLELDFTYPKWSVFEIKRIEMYTFPSNLNFQGKSFLKHLHLSHCLMSQSAVDCIISGCVDLESLILTECGLPLSVFICNPLSRLKSLVFKFCKGASEIDLSVNITTFQYRGFMTHLNLVGAPFVESVSLELLTVFVNESSCMFNLLANELPQLQNLKIFFSTRKLTLIPDIMPKFCHLKELELLVDLHSNFDLISVAFILNASPCLQKFHLVLQHEETKHKLDTRAVSEQLYYFELKQVEISGFYDRCNALDLVRHLLTKAVRLERMIIDFHNIYNKARDKWSYRKYPHIDREMKRIHHLLLEENLNPRAELLVL